MESQFAGQRAQCLDSSKSNSSKTVTINSTKPIFNISGSSKGVESSTTAAVESKKEVPQVNVSFTSSSEEQSKCKAVKAVLYKVVRVYESRPANTMKYLGIVCILLLFVGVMSIALAQEATEDKTQSKYGMAFTLGETAASSASSEKFVAPSAPESAAVIIDGTNATSSTEEPVVTTIAPKVDEVKSDVDNGNSTSEEKVDNQNDESNFSNRPSMVIDNEDDEKTEDDPNPRIVFIERLMGLHLSAPANKGDGQGEQKDYGNEQAPNPIRNDKVNAKWAARTRKFTIPIPNQGEPQGMMPPQAMQEHPMLRFAAAAMMSRLIAAAARAQMEAQAREAIQARSKDDESEENSIPMILAAVRDGQSVSRLPIQPHPQMYGQPKMMRPPFAYQQQQQPRQMPSMAHPSFMAPMQQRPNIVIQRRIAPVSQPVVVMLAVPSQQQSVYSHRPQMPYYPSVPYSVPVMYRQQMPAASMAMPIQIQRPAYVQSYAQPRHVLAVPVDHMHYPAQHQHQVIAIRPQMIESAIHASHDHQASPSEPNHMVFVYDAEVQHDDADDLEPSASEDREEPYHNKAKLNHYIERHLPANPTPNKIKLWREMMNAKHAAQTGVRYIPVSVASSEEQSQPPINHFLPQKRFAFQKPQESSMRPTFVLLANHQPEN